MSALCASQFVPEPFVRFVTGTAPPDTGGHEYQTSVSCTCIPCCMLNPPALVTACVLDHLIPNALYTCVHRQASAVHSDRSRESLGGHQPKTRAIAEQFMRHFHSMTSVILTVDRRQARRLSVRVMYLF